jgi:photosystem II stability/assembly factor-like uncharacterized protein
MTCSRAVCAGRIFACIVLLTSCGALLGQDTQPKPQGILGITLGRKQVPQPTDPIMIDRVLWGCSGQKAGLKHGDIVVAVNGQKMTSNKDVAAAINPLREGDSLTITIDRGGKQQDFKITLGGDPPTVGPLGPDWKKGDAAGVTQDHAVETLTLPDSVAKTPLRSVSFIDAADGWIVGGTGVCLRTTDGGKSWTTLEMNAGANFRTVQFSADGTGWITGDGEPNSIPPRGHVEFTLPMVSATLYRTTDGGANWSVGWVPTNFQLYAIATSPDEVVLGTFGGDAHPDGSAIIFGTNLVGKAIQRTFRSLFAMAMPSKGHVIAVGTPVRVGFGGLMQVPTILSQANCRAIVSNDGGTTWDASKGSDGNDYLRGLATSGEKVAIAVGDNGTILRSEDAGDSWTAITGATKESLSGVASDGKKTFVAVGNQGTVIASHDEGKTWKAVDTGLRSNLHGVSAAGAFFYVVGDHGTALRIKLD